MVELLQERLVERLSRLRIRRWPRPGLWFGGLLLAGLLAIAAQPSPDSFRFVLLGDRTGEAQPGVFEQVCKEAATEKPAFVVSVGDTIQGLDDSTSEREWRQAAEILKVFGRTPLYLAAGNHDIWSAASERLFQKYAVHAPHYSFDYAQAHFMVLDNSRSDELAVGELAFLESDLKAHAAQPVKFIVMHRPSWLLNVAMKNADFPLHRLAKRYGVQYVIAGHVHQMLRLELEGVTYVSMASSGGHLRLSAQYADGWFFAHGLIAVHGSAIDFQIKETGPPRGQGRTTEVLDWGAAGLLKK
jgi:3',5'-cyclic-AMP phosphodiesterase